MTRSFNDRILVGGFCAFKADLASIAKTFTEWQNKQVLASVEEKVTLESLSGMPSQLLDLAGPLVSPVPTKWLFLGVNSNWTVVIDNGKTGTDAGIAPVLSKKHACLSVRGLSIPHTFNVKLNSGRYGAEIFESYLNGVENRIVYCVNDGGRWKFGQNGEPYAIEDVTLYDRKLTRERFTRKELLAILQFLQIPIHLSGESLAEKIPGLLAKRSESSFEGHKEYIEFFGEN